MSDTVTAALIAGTVSVIVAMISFFVSAKANAASRRRLIREIRSGFYQNLWKERVESYAEAFKITGELSRRKAPQYINPREEISDLRNQIIHWSSGKPALLMSGDSIKALRELTEAMSRNPGHGDAYAEEQVDKIFKLRSDLRRQLRKDVLSIFHKQEDQR